MDHSSPLPTSSSAAAAAAAAATTTAPPQPSSNPTAHHHHRHTSANGTNANTTTAAAAAATTTNNNNAAAATATPTAGGRVNHSEQLEQLRRVLPDPPNGAARAQILEHTINVIGTLMQRATFLAVELAVASPEATRRWVRTCSGCGQKPFIHTVGSVMKLFSMRKNWRYAEWWALDERKPETVFIQQQQQQQNQQKRVKREPAQTQVVVKNGQNNSTTVTTTIVTNADNDTATTPVAAASDENADSGGQVDKPAGVMEDPGNVHGCVVRDSESVMRLAWTLINRNNTNGNDASMMNDGHKSGMFSSDAAAAATYAIPSANTMNNNNNNNMNTTQLPQPPPPPPSHPPPQAPLGGDAAMLNNNLNTTDNNATTAAAAAVSNDDVRNMIEFARESQRYEFRPRVGMPGRVWTSRRAEWLTNLKDSEVFVRSPLAHKFGMETCLAVPIQFGGHVHSVMAFFSLEGRPYDSDSYDLACTLARCVEEVYSPNRAGPWITGSDSHY